MTSPSSSPSPQLSPPPGDVQMRRARLLIAVLGIGLIYALLPYLPGLLGGAVLYVVCLPAYRWLAARTRRPTLAAALVVVAAAVLILLPGGWLASLVISEAPDIFRRLQGGTLITRLETLHIGSLEVGPQLARAGGSIVSWISAQAIGFFGSATRGLLNLVIALFGLFYMLLSADGLWDRFRSYLPFSAANVEQLRERFHSVTDAMILGTVAVALVQGAIIGVGFQLVGLPNALFWGGITAVASILPVLGSALVWLPGVVVLVLQSRYGAAVALLVIGAVIASNIDNVIRPLIYRRVSNVHPMITLVGAFAGVSLFGLVGLLLGPLAISYFFELLRMYDEEYGARATGAGRDGGSGESTGGGG